jgi:hypothetical protein
MSRFIPAILLVLFIGACAAQIPGDTSPSNSASSLATASAVADELLQAIRFRRAWGLRSDEEWVVAVAANPLSEGGRREWGVPLLPFEVTDLEGRPMSGSEFVRIIEQYGASVPNDWAGVFIDQPNGGVIAAQFSGNVAIHQSVIEGLLPDGAQIDVRQVQWSLRDLDELGRSVEGDRAWFLAAGLALIAADSDVMSNVVLVRFTGSPESEPLVRDHFQARPWAQPTWDGYGPWRGPLGNLTIAATDARGHPVQDLWCDYRPDDPAADSDGINLNTRKDGRCELKGIAVSVYTVELKTRVGDGWLVVGSGRAEVTPDGTTIVRIEVSTQ